MAKKKAKKAAPKRNHGKGFVKILKKAGELDYQVNKELPRSIKKNKETEHKRRKALKDALVQKNMLKKLHKKAKVDFAKVNKKYNDMVKLADY